jgi:FkbM family methyltransferase
VIDDARFITRHFETCATYQISNIRFLKKIQPHSRLTVDVGANWGMNTVEYAQFSDHVVSFEPYPDLYTMLLRNIDANECTFQVTAHRIALHHADIRYPMTYHNNGLANRYNPQRGDVVAESQCLDDFGLDPDIIKIDTEGTEWYVVQGADETIQRSRPICQIELDNHWQRYGINIQHLFDYFLNQDYVCVDKQMNQYQRYEKKRMQMDRFFIPREKYDAVK